MVDLLAKKMRDFTLTIYKKLLVELNKANYRFTTFTEFLETRPGEEKLIILRHDIDRLPEQALRMAKIEHEMGLQASYYFRCRQNGFDTIFIKDIAALGHEIGYHYETMDNSRGNIENAFKEFKKNLESLRELVPVTTICRHGSPRSKWDNGEIWKTHDYKALGIIAEPYLDIDFREVMYLTDTGRMWDGDMVSIRDKVRDQTTENKEQKEKNSWGAVCSPPVLHLHSTGDIMKALTNNRLADKIMLTIHPQRWRDRFIPWTKELVWQNMKNVVKYFIARSNSW
jgi:hypothetical protein